LTVSESSNWQSLRVEINAALKDGGRAMTIAPAALRGKWLVVLREKFERTRTGS
jgi:hypothetical protein